MTAARPRLLFLSPVAPALGGNGLAMRAGVLLEALAARHDVSLLVVPVAGPGEPAPALAARCAATAMLPLAGREDGLFRLIARVRDPGERLAALERYPRPLLCCYATAEAVRAAAGAFPQRFDAVHVFRLYLAPFAGPHLTAGVPVRLDLDDIESRTRRRLANLHEEAGDTRAARFERAEAARYEGMEAEWLPRFARVDVCSADDAGRLRDRLAGLRVSVVPNAVRLPPTPAPAPPGPFTLLFVGNLGYYPNEDALRFFCARVLPALRARAPGPFRLRVVGASPGPAVRALAAHPEVDVIGPVDDVAEQYARASAVIAPLRGGGGTRIKVLEAFAFRRPVVATTIGVEGLEVRDGEHLLLADEPEALATACAGLMAAPSEAAALAARAFAFVAAHHTVARVAAALAAP